MSGRGPTARRGLQFRATPLDELLRRHEAAQQMMRRLDWLARHPESGRADMAELRRQSQPELAQRRRETLALLTDLRAELRRRAGR